MVLEVELEVAERKPIIRIMPAGWIPIPAAAQI